MKSYKDLSEEYRKWWNSLKKNEKKRLIQSGCFNPKRLHQPELEDDRTAPNDTPTDFQPFDADEKIVEGAANYFKKEGKSRIKYFKSAADEVIEKEEAKPEDKANELMQDRLNSLLFFIIESMEKSKDKNTNLEAQVIKIVIGHGKPLSQIELANKYQVTKQFVSLKCRNLMRKLGVPSSIYLRPDDEIESMKISMLLLKEKNK